MNSVTNIDNLFGRCKYNLTKDCLIFDYNIFLTKVYQVSNYQNCKAWKHLSWYSKHFWRYCKHKE